jgi:hypothetical protein
MGNAYAALAEGIEASYYNPAGLPKLESKQLAVSYRPLSLGRDYSFIGFGLPIRPRAKEDEKVFDGGFSLSWTRAGVRDIDGRNTDGFHTDNLSNSENAFVFAFALSPAQKLSLGLAVKVLWNRFPGIGQTGETVSANGVGFDFGVLYAPRRDLAVGLVLRDINAKYRWNTEALYDEDASETTDEFPKSLRIGVVFRPRPVAGLTLVADYEQLYDVVLFRDKIDDRYYFGVEKVAGKLFALRAGWDDGSVGAGLGYSFALFGKTSQLNYAYLAANERPVAEHVFTWVLQF